ncbi:MAG: hypothetical protein JXB85_11570 [Anaerolineales bacterium]|nr:hypothetical protein [Anaerolineales bacterium]
MTLLIVLCGSAACSPIPTPAAAAASATVTEPFLMVSTATPTPTAPPATPTSAACTRSGTVEAGMFDSDYLAWPLRFLVYLPPCYSEQTERRYPILYLLHGLASDETQWPRLGATDTADELIRSGQALPFLIVMPYDPTWSQPPDSDFDEALVEELIPYVDAAYRTRTGRLDRAIGGLSRGAGWAVHIGLNRPDLFGSIGAHSPVVFWRDGIHVSEWLGDILPEMMPAIYLDAGDQDSSLPVARELEILLDDADVSHEWHLNTGFHDEDYWSEHVEEYLRWYVSNWH